jgi:hypothetical protein
MKTGRMLKFHRSGTDIHAYLYREGAEVRASLYVLPAERGKRPRPLPTFAGATEAEVETHVRAWIETHFPKTT